MLVLLALNEAITFFFSSLEGVESYGTYHKIIRLSEMFILNLEQLFWQTTKFLKIHFCHPTWYDILLYDKPER
uniref:Uncharacterized protein n=1 Tax=Fervidobacterium thailandense TaxID=1008305 RepID=A0A7C4GJ55_9BACT